jgi:hypothetical protein
MPQLLCGGEAPTITAGPSEPGCHARDLRPASGQDLFQEAAQVDRVMSQFQPLREVRVGDG